MLPSHSKFRLLTLCAVICLFVPSCQPMVALALRVQANVGWTGLDSSYQLVVRARYFDMDGNEAEVIRSRAFCADEAVNVRITLPPWIGTDDFCVQSGDVEVFLLPGENPTNRCTNGLSDSGLTEVPEDATLVFSEDYAFESDIQQFSYNPFERCLHTAERTAELVLTP